MARRVFFSFHYSRDVWRAGQIRNCWITKPDREAAGFWDAAAWEEVKKKGKAEVQKWIDVQLKGTSVTVVLIGAETSNRDYVIYELEQSWGKSNGIFGIYIHQLKDRLQRTDTKGNNTFGPIFPSVFDNKKYFFERFPTYDWVDDNGYKNIGDWISEAARLAGR